MGTSDGVGEVMYEVGDVLVWFSGDNVFEVGSWERFRLYLGVCENGDALLVYDGEVGEEHVYTTRPAIRVLGSTLYQGDRCGML